MQESDGLEPLNFPDFGFRVRAKGQIKEIFDVVRRKFVPLTPEEWVRQNLIRYMHEHCGYPLARMAVEKQVRVNGLSQRADIVVFDDSGSPWLIAECKSAAIKLNEDVFYQAARYNMTLQVPFVVLTNGLEHVCLRLGTSGVEFMDGLPEMQSKR
jgi:type I site-specific restriction endonuclease